MSLELSVNTNDRFPKSDRESSRKEIMDRLGLKNEEHFRKTYLVPDSEAGLVERTIPAKPRSSKQRYRLTPKGRGI